MQLAVDKCTRLYASGSQSHRRRFIFRPKSRTRFIHSTHEAIPFRNLKSIRSDCCIHRTLSNSKMDCNFEPFGMDTDSVAKQQITTAASMPNLSLSLSNI